MSNLSPLLKGRNKKVIGLMKDELDGKLTTVWCIEIKTTDNSNENKNAKSIKKSHKKKIKFEDYKNYLEVTQVENKTKRLEKISVMWIIFEKIKIALSANDYKRMHSIDSIDTYT